MLRNRLLPLQYAYSNLQLQYPAILGKCQRTKSSSGASNVSATRQSKILGKLFGNRVAGTKKRWYPGHDAINPNSSSGYQPPSVVFQASQFGKSNSTGSKHNIRRMAVLNKLFMTHITDLLANGEAAESILGRGMQVSRVKISSDFSCINVYWLGSGQVQSDIELETTLQCQSGQLRHELSQLRLMGEVPRIKFVRDKTGYNTNSVDSILRTLNLNRPEDSEECQEDTEAATSHGENFDVALTARQEFYGSATIKTADNQLEMRHDVFGLDHRLIMDKVLTKMRKSKQAWQQHQQQGEKVLDDTEPTSIAMPAQSQRKMPEQESTDKFEAFLAKRRERKQTPERKKYRREHDDWTMVAMQPGEPDDLQLLSEEQRKRYNQEDYILEDDKDSNHKT